jgi:hypothetical protein
VCGRRTGVAWRGFTFFTAVCRSLATLGAFATLTAAPTTSAPATAAAFAMLFAAVAARGPRLLGVG